MGTFFLLPQFATKLHVCDLSLSRVLLNDTVLPWIFLVPMRQNIVQINELIEADQLQLIREISLVSNTMQKLFPCDRLNIAAIGNKTPQLHIHIICRTQNDPYWPETVWQYSCETLPPEEYRQRCEMIKCKLEC